MRNRGGRAGQVEPLLEPHMAGTCRGAERGKECQMWWRIDLEKTIWTAGASD